MKMKKMEVRGMEVEFASVSGYRVNMWDSVLIDLLFEIIKEKTGIKTTISVYFDEDNGHLQGFEIDADDLNESEIQIINDTFEVDINEDPFGYANKFRYELYEYIFGNIEVETHSSDAFSGRGDVEFNFFLTEDEFNHFKTIGIK